MQRYIFQFTSMQSFTNKKISQCCTIVVQNVETQITNNMIFKLVQDQKIQAQVKRFNFNSNDKKIIIQFNTHEQAIRFYTDANFNVKLLMRPISISMSIILTQNEVRKFYFEGLVQENMRRMFEIINKRGLCKIKNSPSGLGKLRSYGTFSIIRNCDFSSEEYTLLKQELKQIDVRLFPLMGQKILKCTLELMNFFEQSKKNEKVEERAQEKARKMIFDVLETDEDIDHVTISTKEKFNSEIRDYEQLVKASISFKDYQSSLTSYEKMRKAYLNDKKVKMLLNFTHAEINSYISLFSSGLEKPEDLSEKLFENQLLMNCRKINKEVVQVLVFPVKLTNTYIARVYLKSEDAGKQFIISYPFKKELLTSFYKDSSNIKFNINVDDKTFHKIKNMKKRGKEIFHEETQAVKNLEKSQKLKQVLNKIPIHPKSTSHLPPHILPNIPVLFPSKESNLPNFARPVIQGCPPPIMGSHFGMEGKISKFVKDRERFEELEKIPQNIPSLKASLFPPLRYVLEKYIGIPESMTGLKADEVLQKHDISTIIKILENHEAYFELENP